MRDALHRMFAHLAWADTQVLNSLKSSPPERAMKLYAHVLGSEHTWLSRIHGTSPTIEIWPTLTFEICEDVAAKNHQQFTAMLDLASEHDLARMLDYVNSKGQQFSSRVSDILLHVALHGSYHRGQIASTVREADGAPSPTDFIVFAREFPSSETN